ncbi:bcl-2-like protein 10 [Rhinatrema bivittatum]|uniref:bcl-2-like protein 10 n=1 Tax=Rhinatrema bivittatum TaxID=194408 RepID=UPI00112B488A|nr:bcl-2-like protein 10 [Rhinatrema bivittatum]
MGWERPEGSCLAPGRSEPCSRSSSMPADPLREETRLLLRDYFQHCSDGGACGQPPTPSPPSPGAAATLRRVSAEVHSLHRDFYASCLAAEALRHQEPGALLLSVARQMEEEGGLNWGRLVSLVVFAGVLLQRGGGGTESRLTDVLCDYLTKDKRQWLEANGGWDGFNRFFDRRDPEQVQQNGPIGNAIMAAAGFGLAGLAFLLVVR